MSDEYDRPHWCVWRICHCTRAVRARLMCAVFETQTYRQREGV